MTHSEEKNDNQSSNNMVKAYKESIRQDSRQVESLDTLDIDTLQDRLRRNLEKIRSENQETLSSLEDSLLKQYAQWKEMRTLVESERESLEKAYSVTVAPNDLPAIIAIKKEKQGVFERELSESQALFEKNIQEKEAALAGRSQDFQAKCVRWEEMMLQREEEFDAREKQRKEEFERLKKYHSEEFEAREKDRQQEQAQLHVEYEQKSEALIHQFELKEKEMTDSFKLQDEMWSSKLKDEHHRYQQLETEFQDARQHYEKLLSEKHAQYMEKDAALTETFNQFQSLKQEKENAAADHIVQIQSIRTELEQAKFDLRQQQDGYEVQLKAYQAQLFQAQQSGSQESLQYQTIIQQLKTELQSKEEELTKVNGKVLDLAQKHLASMKTPAKPSAPVASQAPAPKIHKPVVKSVAPVENKPVVPATQRRITPVPTQPPVQQTGLKIVRPLKSGSRRVGA